MRKNLKNEARLLKNAIFLGDMSSFAGCKRRRGNDKIIGWMVPVGEKMLDQLTEATELHIEQYEAPAYNLLIIFHIHFNINSLSRWLHENFDHLITNR